MVPLDKYLQILTVWCPAIVKLQLPAGPDCQRSLHEPRTPPNIKTKSNITSHRRWPPTHNNTKSFWYLSGYKLPHTYTHNIYISAESIIYKVQLFIFHPNGYAKTFPEGQLKGSDLWGVSHWAQQSGCHIIRVQRFRFDLRHPWCSQYPRSIMVPLYVMSGAPVIHSEGLVPFVILFTIMRTQMICASSQYIRYTRISSITYHNNPVPQKFLHRPFPWNSSFSRMSEYEFFIKHNLIAFLSWRII